MRRARGDVRAGHVRWQNGFALRFQTTQTKRDKLADKLVWLTNREALGLVEERGAQRFAAEGPAIIIRQDGRRLQCRVQKGLQDPRNKEKKHTYGQSKNKEE